MSLWIVAASNGTFYSCLYLLSTCLYLLRPCCCSYFVLVVGSVLVSMGRCVEALAQYMALDGELSSHLPAGHPNLALLHSATGFALYATGQLPQAFERFVQVGVLHVHACASLYPGDNKKCCTALHKMLEPLISKAGAS